MTFSNLVTFVEQGDMREVQHVDFLRADRTLCSNRQFKCESIYHLGRVGLTTPGFVLEAEIGLITRPRGSPLYK